MKWFVLTLMLAIVGFAVYWFGFRAKSTPGGVGVSVTPGKVVPPTTAGGIVDQTLGLVNQGISIYGAASDLYNKWS